MHLKRTMVINQQFDLDYLHSDGLLHHSEMIVMVNSAPSDYYTKFASAAVLAHKHNVHVSNNVLLLSENLGYNCYCIAECRCDSGQRLINTACIYAVLAIDSNDWR